jgi:hypothetical protein
METLDPPVTPVAGAGPAAARLGAASLRLGLAVGVGLFYLYMLLPARLQESISLLVLAAPENALLYGVGYPYFTILDAVMLAWGIASWVTARGRRHVRSVAVLAYVGVSLACAVIAYQRYTVGQEASFYWDGALGAVRLLAVYAVFAGTPGRESNWSRRLQDALAVLFLSSLALNLAGFGNRATLSNEANRMTASGLDFATTSYFGAVLALSAITGSAGRRRQALVVVGLVGVAMGGGRNALVIGVLTLGVMMLQGSVQVPRVVMRFALGAVALSLVALVLFPQVLARIPALQRQRDDAAYYQRRPELTPMSLRYFPFLRRSNLSEPATVGRVNTWASALALLEDRRWEPASSDWSVQKELDRFNVPSHSHNGYLQSALKFGPLAALVWLPLFVSAWRGVRARSPHGPILFFLLLSLMVDYWMLVGKALFLLYAYAGLNDAWLAERRLVQRRAVPAVDSP